MGWPQGSVGGVALSLWGWSVCLLYSEARYMVDCLLVALPCFFLECQLIWVSLPQRSPGNIYGPNLSVEEMAVAMSLPPFQFSDHESVHLYICPSLYVLWGGRDLEVLGNRAASESLCQFFLNCFFLVRSNKRLSSIILQSSALLHWV